MGLMISNRPPLSVVLYYKSSSYTTHLNIVISILPLAVPEEATVMDSDRHSWSPTDRRYASFMKGNMKNMDTRTDNSTPTAGPAGVLPTTRWPPCAAALTRPAATSSCLRSLHSTARTKAR
eukprot:scaffold49589_cov399-Isochrysis_galbana.AAC.1